MIAAGYDLPYVQAQVGHDDPNVTLSMYAQVMRRADRDELKAEIRELLGVSSEGRATGQSQRSVGRVDAPIRSFQGVDLSAIVRGIER
jgi:hypothetical protein